MPSAHAKRTTLLRSTGALVALSITLTQPALGAESPAVDVTRISALKLTPEELIGMATALGVDMLAWLAKRPERVTIAFGRVKNRSATHLQTAVIAETIEKQLLSAGAADVGADVRHSELVAQGVYDGVRQADEEGGVSFHQLKLELIRKDDNRKVWIGESHLKKIYTFPPVEALLADVEAGGEQRVVAIDALVRMGARAKPVVALLLGELESRDERVKLTALSDFARFTDRADASQRRAGCDITIALAEGRGARELRRKAILALGERWGGESEDASVSALQRLLIAESDRALRLAVFAAVRGKGLSFVPALLAQAAGGDAELATAARLALSSARRASPKEVLPLLQVAAAGKDAAVVRVAKQELVQLEFSAAPCADIVAALGGEPRELVAAAANDIDTSFRHWKFTERLSQCMGEDAYADGAARLLGFGATELDLHALCEGYERLHAAGKRSGEAAMQKVILGLVAALRWEGEPPDELIDFLVSFDAALKRAALERVYAVERSVVPYLSGALAAVSRQGKREAFFASDLTLDRAGDTAAFAKAIAAADSLVAEPARRALARGDRQLALVLLALGQAMLGRDEREVQALLGWCPIEPALLPVFVALAGARDARTKRDASSKLAAVPPSVEAVTALGGVLRGAADAALLGRASQVLERLGPGGSAVPLAIARGSDGEVAAWFAQQEQALLKEAQTAINLGLRARDDDTCARAMFALERLFALGQDGRNALRAVAAQAAKKASKPNEQGGCRGRIDARVKQLFSDCPGGCQGSEARSLRP